MQQEDVERIARAALRELGIGTPTLAISRDPARPDCWTIGIPGSHAVTIRCGPGTTPQWVRTQIFEQFQGR